MSTPRTARNRHRIGRASLALLSVPVDAPITKVCDCPYTHRRHFVVHAHLPHQLDAPPYRCAHTMDKDTGNLTKNTFCVAELELNTMEEGDQDIALARLIASMDRVHQQNLHTTSPSSSPTQPTCCTCIAEARSYELVISPELSECIVGCYAPMRAVARRARPVRLAQDCGRAGAHSLPAAQL